jgi:type II secretory pathway predicted ATPase ExeA
MYEAFFHLRERPFELTTTPRFLFLTARHREALSNLQYGILGRRGITLLLGEAGTGKTTLVRAALELQRAHNIVSVYVGNPRLTRAEFYEMLAAGFDLGPAAAHSKARFLLELDRTLIDRHRTGGISALFLDEAQSLSDELLEEVRLLSNLETGAEKTLPVVLSGQIELADRLNEPSLRQLKQRVALRCTLLPLDLRETAAYIAKRVRIAGGDAAALFTADAVKAIFQRSGGIPRTVNVICDNALVTAFALQRPQVDRDIVLEVCRDFDLEPASRLAPAADVPTAGPGAPVEAEDSRPAAAPAVAGELFASFARRRRFKFF